MSVSDYTKSLERLLQYAQEKMTLESKWDTWNELNDLIVIEILTKDLEGQMDMIKNLSTSNIRFDYSAIFINTAYKKVLDKLVRSYSKCLDTTTIKNKLKKDDTLFIYKTTLLKKITDTNLSNNSG